MGDDEDYLETGGVNQNMFFQGSSADGSPSGTSSEGPIFEESKLLEYQTKFLEEQQAKTEQTIASKTSELREMLELDTVRKVKENLCKREEEAMLNCLKYQSEKGKD